MDSIGYADWQRWHREGCTRLPAALVVSAASFPSSWTALTDAPATVLLESAQSGRYTYVCDRPARVILGSATQTQVWSADGKTLLERKPGQPLEVLRALFAAIKTPTLGGWPAMAGGMIGVFGYDLVGIWEKLPLTAKRDLPLPLFALIETGELFIYDHLERTLRIVVWCDLAADAGDELLSQRFHAAQQAVHDACARWQGGEKNPHGPDRPSPVDPGRTPPPSFTPEEFKTAVCRAQDYIAAGHTYQVNLSRRTSRETALPATVIYQELRRVNPSPYMGLLRLPEFALVCGSPELLVRLVGGVVSSRPIAGTRPRGEAAKEDANFSAELFASEKERAEHLMLVDLIRNDIGRVAEYGSVEVKEFMVLERYSHVMHIVSQVEGRLAAGRTWVEVLQSMFPGGTITGCPKFRTMEIIEELEPVGRGFYTGALGWISYGGEMEMNIVIRSMLVQHGIAHVQAGAGIVADSQPERELDEATRKAQALWVALEAAIKRHG
ncbi:MAG TPA: anthranilate synthase component I family protein [Opitutaceae bacterium]|nr:anthranilate synthase component I family protein [Opitutaceae bacterium]